MMMERSRKYKLDKRDTEDLHKEFGKLAAAYTPEWHFTTDDPDIASVIGIIFADQMQENIDRFNQMLYQYHTAFVNLLGVSLRPAMPAKAVLIVELADPSLPGTVIRKGTQFIGGTDGTDPVIYETTADVYVTGQNIRDAFMVSGQTGAIIPLLGAFSGFSYMDDIADRIIPAEDEIHEEEDRDDIDGQPEDGNGIRPFTVYEFADMGIARNSVILLHEYMLDTGNDILHMEIKGRKIADEIAEGKIKILYPAAGRLREVEEVTVRGENVFIKKTGSADRLIIRDNRYDMLVLERDQAPEENLECRGILFSSEGQAVRPEYLGNASRDETGQIFCPFGDELALYKEAYIGCDRYLGKAGAKITLSFELDVKVHYMGPELNPEEDLRPIKKKPRFVFNDTVSDSYIQEVALEYFNGTGWKRLECDQDTRGLFNGDHSGNINLTFICPSDVMDVVAGGYHGRALRLVILKADNCYLMPCNHHYPAMNRLTIAYTYENHYVQPQRCYTVAGTCKKDLTPTILSGKPFMAFQRPIYTDDAIYLGFVDKPRSGPVSMYVELDDESDFQTVGMELDYSAAGEFKRLRASDHTGGLGNSGIIYFMPPDDFTAVNLEGRKRYWIRLRKTVKAGFSTGMANPVIKNITMNAVNCENVYELPEQTCYMDQVVPNKTFELFADQIFDADVWVNEFKQHNQPEMQAYAEAYPDRVRMEKDFIGNITSFYVKWVEVDNFHHSTKEDRHYILDRMNSRIHFGDGVHVMIPRETEDDAMIVRLRVCQGAAGNLPERGIVQPGSNLMFIGDVYNPVRAYGGTDVESLDRALMRGANRINGRGRLITEQDYERELKAFNPSIEKIKCIPAVAPDGSENPEVLSIVILVHDYKTGSFAFNKEKENVKNHLLKNCELAIDPDYLEVREPILVAISVEIWLDAESMDDCYMVIEDYKEALDAYLDPVSGGQGKGWEIGKLPAPTQIRMRVNTVRTKAAPTRINIVASYNDIKGLHEVELENIDRNPYYVGYSGNHKIHIDVRK